MDNGNNFFDNKTIKSIFLAILFGLYAFLYDGLDIYIFVIFFVFITIIIALFILRRLSDAYNSKSYNSVEEDALINSSEMNNKSLEACEMPSIDESQVYVQSMNEFAEKIINKKDPLFNSTTFVKWGSNVFCMLWDAWLNKDLAVIERFETEALYSEHKNIIVNNQEIDLLNGEVLPLICQQSFICDCKIKDDFEFITLYFKAVKRSVATDEQIKTNVDFCPSIKYFIVFKRKNDFLAASNAVITCPGCGAQIKGGVGNKCKYCGATLQAVKDNDWEISGISFNESTYAE